MKIPNSVLEPSYIELVQPSSSPDKISTAAATDGCLTVISSTVIGRRDISCFTLNRIVFIGSRPHNGGFQARLLLL
jgi:hypothetical protein